ncbi:MAG TPA: hypothetical protein VI793_10955 [Anaerolineales bacterium]|nr:hypothetical protein [Anaerolineales bacterium]
MTLVMGLIRQGENVTASIQKLNEAGFTRESIRAITDENEVKNLLGGDPRSTVARYAAWGVGIGIVTYGIFGLACAWCQCSLCGYGPAWGIVAFVGAVLAGTFVGGVLGSFAGMAESEEQAYYVQGVQSGGKLLALRVDKEQAITAKRVLMQAHAAGVRSLQR